MSPGFIHGFAQWLHAESPLPVRCAKDNGKLCPGMLYFAPDEVHLRIVHQQGTLHARLTDEPRVDGFKPSATVLLQSVAEVCGKKAIGGLLSGMGSDGADGLLQLRNAHGHTFVQDEQSCLVPGMPNSALACGAVDKVVPLEQIAHYLSALCRPH